MINIKIDPRILEACPECRIGLIRATVVNGPTSDGLWAEIEAAAEEIKQIADYISLYGGGKGCVRAVIEQVMRLQDKWFHADAVNW